MKQLKPKPRYDYTFFKGLEAMNSEAITKQEEIREGVERILDELLFSGDGGDTPYEEGKCIRDLLTYLHSKGVVIKVDRECDYCHGAGKHNFYSTTYEACVDTVCSHCEGVGKAVAVEDLI